MNRGDVYRIRPGRDRRGHEQAGARYAIVAQTDAVRWSTVLVVPTSTSCAPSLFRPEVDVLDRRTRAMTDQLSVLDPQIRFGEHVGRLTPTEIHALDQALRLVLALD